MGLTSIHSIAAAPDTASSAAATPASDRSFNRAVSTAVDQLNDSGYAGQHREITFSIDQPTKRPVIKVVDTSTNEVIAQWPPEYVLQLAAENKTNG